MYHGFRKTVKTALGYRFHTGDRVRLKGSKSAGLSMDAVLCDPFSNASGVTGIVTKLLGGQLNPLYSVDVDEQFRHLMGYRGMTFAEIDLSAISDPLEHFDDDLFDI